MTATRPPALLTSDQTRTLCKETASFQQRLMQHKLKTAASRSARSHTEIALSIRGVFEHCKFDERFALIVGRVDVNNRFKVDVDLSPYGAAERGVSRVHLQFVLLPGNRLYAIDLNSSNGTYLNGELCQPYHPYLLHDGDRLLLGTLPVQVFFK